MMRIYQVMDLCQMEFWGVANKTPEKRIPKKLVLGFISLLVVR